MEQINNPFPWLELMDRPAFCVKDGAVVALNAAAAHRMLDLGTNVQEILKEHYGAYQALQNGRLYVTAYIGGIPCNASVTRTLDCDIFVVNQDLDDGQLQALALAAQQLRIPLSNVMTVYDQMATNGNDDPVSQQQASQMNQGLYQLMRIISNMSDAGYYQNAGNIAMESVDLAGVFDEIMEKVQATYSDQEITISYSGLPFSVFAVANTEKLERAVYNLISNAVKFATDGSNVDVKLGKNEDLVSFTVTNTYDPASKLPSFWDRYRREPAIEDPRYGVGLGMTLVSSVAACHGGTVLIDHPTEGETRVTMTVSAQQKNSDAVRSPVMRIGDYAGGRDRALLELSDVLSADSYKKVN